MSFRFKQSLAIGRNTALVSLGTPFSLILQLMLLACGLLLACLPFFSFGEHLRLIRDQSLALCLIAGCLGSAFGASQAITEDIREGAAAIMMSRPVSSLAYIVGKWWGLYAGVLLIQVTATGACLWLTAITSNENHLDTIGLALYGAAVIGSLALVGIKQYVFGGTFVWSANVTLAATFLLTFLLSVSLRTAGTVDWKTAQASLMIVFALAIFSSLAVLAAVLFDTGMLLGACVLLFFGGLLSDSFLTVALPSGWALAAGRALLPNWQLFWISDRLAEGKTVPTATLAHSAIHAGLYTTLALLAAARAFGRRELEVQA
ncbi:MAG: hypothetical protein KAI66_00550 [Lentisphaeria bacterium]|nr:hypothetical protein [Lentisphaeria bacterium]